MIPNNVMGIINKFYPNIGRLNNVKTPDEMAQYLLDTGKVNQDLVNRSRQMWNNNPQIQQHINNQYK